jgi:hypothetical protein
LKKPYWQMAWHRIVSRVKKVCLSVKFTSDLGDKGF